MFLRILEAMCTEFMLLLGGRGGDGPSARPVPSRRPEALRGCPTAAEAEDHGCVRLGASG